MSTKYRVTMTSNAAASRLHDQRVFEGVAARCRHNGGKLVIMETDAKDSLEAALEGSNAVATYVAY